MSSQNTPNRSSRIDTCALATTMLSSTICGPTSAYTLLNTSISTCTPCWSSMVTIAHGEPSFLDTRRSTAEIMPPICTSAPFFSSSDATTDREVSTCASRASSNPSSGWPDTYSPSMSRSNASWCFRSHVSSGTEMLNTFSATSLSPPSAENRSNWPLSMAFFGPIAASTASSKTIMSPLREYPMESNAPALIRDSVTRLLQAVRSIFSR